MNKDAKRISNSLRPNIDRVKSYIMSALDRKVFFDADGVGKIAIRELRNSGFKIKYHRDRCSYRVDS